MSNPFSYNPIRNQYPLKIVAQIDLVDRDEIAMLEEQLLIPPGSIDLSGMPPHIMEKWGAKVLIAYETIPNSASVK
jgi:hypothetical protein